MRKALMGAVLAVSLLAGAQPRAQTRPDLPVSLSARFVDQTTGLSLEQAIARALDQEPSLRAARSEIEVARGLRVQAGLRPNPTIVLERREEPAGTDNLTMASVEWPLDLFRRHGRTDVAQRQVAATELTVADHERRLAADVRARYGAVLGTVRELALLDELVAATTRQRALLQARVDEGASPPLDRDLLDVEVRRLEADRLLQVGRTEAALTGLKRALGLDASAPLTVRDTLDERVLSEAGPEPPAPTGTSMLEGRPDVREADVRVALADARIDQAEREGRFDLSLYGTYMRMDSGFPQSGVSPDGGIERVRGVFQYVTGGVRISLPLLNRNQGEVAATRAARAGAAALAEAARLTAATEIAAARVQDERAREAVTVYRDAARALARQNLTVVSQSYELGRVTIFDVLAEQRRYLDLERAYVQTLRAAYDARTALTLATGDVR